MRYRKSFKRGRSGSSGRRKRLRKYGVGRGGTIL